MSYYVIRYGITVCYVILYDIYITCQTDSQRKGKCSSEGFGQIQKHIDTPLQYCVCLLAREQTGRLVVRMLLRLQHFLQ